MFYFSLHAHFKWSSHRYCCCYCCCCWCAAIVIVGIIIIISMSVVCGWVRSFGFSSESTHSWMRERERERENFNLKNAFILIESSVRMGPTLNVILKRENKVKRWKRNGTINNERKYYWTWQRLGSTSSCISNNNYINSNGINELVGSLQARAQLMRRIREKWPSNASNEKRNTQQNM